MKQIYRMLITLFVFVQFTSLSYSNGFSLNSVGTRALGMGGAMVGLADDETAIYWNPAGLSNREGAQVQLFVTDIVPLSSFKQLNPDGTVYFSTNTETQHYVAPNLMGYYNIESVPGLTVGLGVYVPSGIGTKWKTNYLRSLYNYYNDDISDIETMSKIGVYDFSPAVAYKINNYLQVGLAVNIYYGMFDLKMPAQNPVAGKKPYQYSESSTGMGYGVTVGLLSKPIDILSIGVSVRTKSTIKMKGSATDDEMTLLKASNSSDFDREMSWPMWFGGGVAVNPIKDLTVALDVQYSQWSQSEDVFTTDFKDAGWQKATTTKQKPTDKYTPNQIVLRWKDALQIRAGIEYKLLKELTVRTGYYYDPAPSPDETYNFLFPSITYNAFTLGVSYDLGVISIIAAGEYLMGKERVITNTPTNDNPAIPGTYNSNVAAFSLGFAYKIK